MTERYMVLRPLLIGGRLAGTGEVVTVPPVVAVEQVEAGRLQPLETAAAEARA